MDEPGVNLNCKNKEELIEKVINDMHYFKGRKPVNFSKKIQIVYKHDIKKILNNRGFMQKDISKNLIKRDEFIEKIKSLINSARINPTFTHNITYEKLMDESIKHISTMEMDEKKVKGN